MKNLLLNPKADPSLSLRMTSARSTTARLTFKFRHHLILVAPQEQRAPLMFRCRPRIEPA